jgi:hypothetical protein
LPLFDCPLHRRKPCTATVAVAVSTTTISVRGSVAGAGWGSGDHGPKHCVVDCRLDVGSVRLVARGERLEALVEFDPEGGAACLSGAGAGFDWIGLCWPV